MGWKIVDGICGLMLGLVIPGALAALVIVHYDLTGAGGFLIGAAIYLVVFLCFFRLYLLLANKNK
jgi:hypothetical protein